MKDLKDLKDMSDEERKEAMEELVDKVDQKFGDKARAAKGWFLKIAGGLFLFIGIIILLTGTYLIGTLFTCIGLILVVQGLAGVSFVTKRVVIGTVIIICGAGFVLHGITTINKGKESTGWPTTPGKIIQSEIEERETTTGTGSDRRTTISSVAQLEYEYSIDGTSYKSRRVSFAQSSQEAQAIVNRYPLGKGVKVYYDPDDHGFAVLEPGLKKGSYFFVGFGGFIALFGLIFMIAGVKKSRS